jgi:hypothetical protein
MLLLISHLSPVKPGGHVQWYAYPGVLLKPHVPEFRHGIMPHVLWIPVTIYRNKEAMVQKWLRYQRVVISLQIQVRNTNQRNKWANTDPRIYRRWDQVPRRSNHPC